MMMVCVAAAPAGAASHTTTHKKRVRSGCASEHRSKKKTKTAISYCYWQGWTGLALQGSKTAVVLLLLLLLLYIIIMYAVGSIVLL